ncbi:MAG: hypothetical protein MZW92_52310 [Comamonadaceae bacterium]|nr:hypothetical protein [Comamonadaceae bacterium]
MWIDAAPARAGPAPGLHRGRCRHRRRHPPQPRDACRMPPSCSAAQETQALLDHVAKDCARSWSRTWCPSCCRIATAAAGAAEPAGGGRARSATCARIVEALAEHAAAHPGPARAHRAGARRAWAARSCSRSTARRSELRRHRARSGARAPADAGAAGRRRTAPALEPGLADTLLRETADSARSARRTLGLPAGAAGARRRCACCSSRFLRRAWPRAQGACPHAEVPDTRTIRVTVRHWR